MFCLIYVCELKISCIGHNRHPTSSRMSMVITLFANEELQDKNNNTVLRYRVRLTFFRHVTLSNTCTIKVIKRALKV